MILSLFFVLNFTTGFTNVTASTDANSDISWSYEDADTKEKELQERIFNLFESSSFHEEKLTFNIFSYSFGRRNFQKL